MRNLSRSVGQTRLEGVSQPSQQKPLVDFDRLRGKVVAVKGGDVEFIILNTTDPWTEVDGERSSVKTKHPSLTDPAVRQALALLIDRKSVQDYIYGRTGIATANWVNNPPRFRSPNTSFEFNIDKASELLEKAGWVKGADGIRARIDAEHRTHARQDRPGQRLARLKRRCEVEGQDDRLGRIDRVNAHASPSHSGPPPSP